MIQRIRPIIVELERQRRSVLVVCHLAVQVRLVVRCLSVHDSCGVWRASWLYGPLKEDAAPCVCLATLSDPIRPISPCPTQPPPPPSKKRCLYGYFMGTAMSEIPYLSLPNHAVLELTPGPHGTTERVIPLFERTDLTE